MKINYEYPMFDDLVEPKGALAINKESHACFYYVMLAMKARAMAGVGIESQIIEYEVGHAAPLWLESRDEEIARSVALIYGFPSPESFLKAPWKKRAWAQAQAIGLDMQEVTKVLNVRPNAPKIH
jgi:hypothetical protein